MIYKTCTIEKVHGGYSTQDYNIGVYSTLEAIKSIIDTKVHTHKYYLTTINGTYKRKCDCGKITRCTIYKINN